MSAPAPATSFASDNHAGAHPEILAALAAANEGPAGAYGADEWTARAEAAFREHFGSGARAFPVFNGTAANVLALAATCRPHEAAICTETAHLNVDECGAPERLAQTKLLPVPAPDGKLTPRTLASRIERRGDQHAVQPRVASISQTTELGTVYSPQEVTALAELAHANGLLLHVDGARIANAAASLDLPLAAITTDCGVDVLTFGGTKNGLLLGEAVVFLRPELADGFPYVRKQLGQLASKMRFVSVQLERLLADGLWLRSAAHANAMARRLASTLDPVGGVELTQPVEANALFARLEPAAIERLLSALPGTPPFHVWDPAAGICRWMCSWETTPGDVDTFAAAVAAAASG